MRGQSNRLARSPYGVGPLTQRRTLFLTDRGCSGFRARFAPERAREQQHEPPKPYPRGEDRHRSVNLRGTK
jgi:hypothetical protein